ncbi:MAG TPA: hypothetical protein VK503_02785 [Candidatus Bathyarchaeia archaeon]|nr:hypothetical protein [Candidatus Bathyarchaeia archaeon]
MASVSYSPLRTLVTLWICLTFAKYLHAKGQVLQAPIETNEQGRSRPSGSSESLLRLLIDSLPAFISYIDSEQRYVLANALYAAFSESNSINS